MEHEPYLEEEHKDQLCKKDCKRIAGSLLSIYFIICLCLYLRNHKQCIHHVRRFANRA